MYGQPQHVYNESLNFPVPQIVNGHMRAPRGSLFGPIFRRHRNMLWTNQVQLLTKLITDCVYIAISSVGNTIMFVHIVTGDTLVCWNTCLAQYAIGYNCCHTYSFQQKSTQARIQGGGGGKGAFPIPPPFSGEKTRGQKPHTQKK